MEMPSAEEMRDRHADHRVHKAARNNRTGGPEPPIGSNEWEEIEVPVDSGATENAMSPDALVSVPITSSPAFVRGAKYEVANGSRFPTPASESLLDTWRTGP